MKAKGTTYVLKGLRYRSDHYYFGKPLGHGQDG
jgi:hypothetical protein